MKLIKHTNKHFPERAQYPLETSGFAIMRIYTHEGMPLMEVKVSDKKTVYVLTDNDDSIIAIFDDYQLAYKARDLYRYASVKEYTLNDSPATECIKHKMKPYRVTIHDDGTTDALQIIFEHYDEGFEYIKDNGKTTEYITYVLAKDEQHAAEIANECKAALVESGAWDEGMQMMVSQKGIRWYYFFTDSKRMFPKLELE